MNVAWNDSARMYGMNRLSDPAPRRRDVGALGDRERRRRELTDGLARAERFTRLMDDGFRVPGLGFRFGLDGVLGLIPGLGDAAGALASAYLVKLARDLGCRPTTIARMVGVAGLDVALGFVPVLGDLADFAFKANRRNLKLMKADLESQKRDLDRRESAARTHGYALAPR